MAIPGWALAATDLVYSVGSSIGSGGNDCVGGSVNGEDLRCLSGCVKAWSGTVLLMVKTLIEVEVEKK